MELENRSPEVRQHSLKGSCGSTAMSDVLLPKVIICGQPITHHSRRREELQLAPSANSKNRRIVLVFKNRESSFNHQSESLHGWSFHQREKQAERFGRVRPECGREDRTSGLTTLTHDLFRFRIQTEHTGVRSAQSCTHCSEQLTLWRRFQLGRRRALWVNVLHIVHASAHGEIPPICPLNVLSRSSTPRQKNTSPSMSEIAMFRPQSRGHLRESGHFDISDLPLGCAR
jgi:hypothetical protein